MPRLSDDCGTVSVTSLMRPCGRLCWPIHVLRTFTAQDGCGQQRTYVQTIAFNDTTAPVITSSPADATYQVSAGEDIPVEFPEAEDACGHVSIRLSTYAPHKGGRVHSDPDLHGMDDCGNETIVTQLVTVNFTLGCDDPAATNYDASGCRW